MLDRFKIPVVVLLILNQDNKILLMRRHNTKWLSGYYDLVGGHLDGNEKLTTATCREAKEEIGITVQPSNAKLVHTLHYLADNTEYLYTFFTVGTWEGTPTILEPDKCDDLSWFDLNNLPEKIAPATKAALAAIHTSTLLTEFAPSKG